MAGITAKEKEKEVSSGEIRGRTMIRLAKFWESNKAPLICTGVLLAIPLLVGAKLCWQAMFLDDPLLDAVGNHDKAEIEKLIAEGANVNCCPDPGEPPLSQAVIDENIDVAAILLSHGADPNMPDHDGDSAAELAKTSEMLRLLEKYGGKGRVPSDRLPPGGKDPNAAESGSGVLGQTGGASNARGKKLGELHGDSILIETVPFGEI